MQIFSPSPIGLLAALTPAERIAELQQLGAPILQALRDNVKTLILLFVLWQVVTILSNWVASKIVAQEEARFINALKSYFLFLLMCILLIVAGGFTVTIAARLVDPHAVSAGLISVGLVIFFALLILASLFAVPMKVYSLTFPRSLGFVLLSVVLQIAGDLALDNTVGRDLIAKDSPFQTALAKIAQSVASQTSGGTAPAPLDADSDERIAGDKTKPTTERQAALKDLYGKLESMFQTLPPGQTAARVEYDARKARYERLLADLRDDVARGR